MKALLALLLILPTFAWAEGGWESTSASVGMSQRLTCQIVTVFQGQLGLLAGLAIAIWGLYLLIRTGNVRTALVMILSGALLSALPTLLMSMLGGFGSFIHQAGISNDDMTDALKEPMGYIGNCDAIEVDFDKYNLSSSGAFAPGGAYSRGTPDMRGAQTAANSSGGSSAGGRVNPADMSKAPGAPGCAERVEGGSVKQRGFGVQRNPYTGEMKMHTGTDIQCRTGAAVTSAQAGRVIEARVSGSLGGPGQRGRGYGNRIVIEHGNGLATTYNHLSQRNVAVGDSVSAGQTVGLCGTTGGSTGPHLHFEVMRNGVYENPVPKCGTS